MEQADNWKFTVGEAVQWIDCHGGVRHVTILALPEPDRGSYYQTDGEGGRLYVPEDMMRKLAPTLP
jgi:hypothetical protein